MKWWIVFGPAVYYLTKCGVKVTQMWISGKYQHYQMRGLLSCICTVCSYIDMRGLNWVLSITIIRNMVTCIVIIECSP